MTTKQIMDIQKFYGALAYYPMTFLPKPLQVHYKYTILKIVKEQMDRRVYNDYSKYFLYLGLRKLGYEYKGFVSDAKPELTEDQLDYIKKLQNLTKNIKRVVYAEKSRKFPQWYMDLTTENLMDHVTAYGKLHRLQRQPDVLMLHDTEYIKLAEKIWPEAEKYYYNEDRPN